MKKGSKYQWQGEPVEVEFGYASVELQKDKAFYWSNYECSISSISGRAVIPAVRVIPFKSDKEPNEPFLIANHFGIGVVKLRSGGWPDMPHHSFPAGTHFEEGKEGRITHFKVLDYNAHEDKRDEYRRQLNPKMYEQMKAVAEGIKKFNQKRE